MSFDKDTRNLLAKTITACRRRLIEDVTDQLRGIFGLHPDGTVLPLGKLTHLSPDQTSAARCLRDLLDHYTVGAAGKESDRRKAAYERMTLEISFTVLNRLAALRLCEERGLVIECVHNGTTSAGFQMFERISGGVLGGRYDTYRVFLECLFDEFALDLGLFDRMTPQSAVFPSERCMEDVLAELNKAELTHLWTEDETIGWIYQYFNPPEERKAMREASQAPRNSRELAVRNQFFTPRYVVEFLTDNTLGRIWYEMRKGDTALKEKCHYLVRRPDEVFLSPREKAPADQGNETDLSKEELLRKPVHIEHRPKKDPRDLRVLDPACGSGHFLLYSFDLLEHIYEEAWEDPECPKSEITGRTLREEFETLDDQRRAAPKLIVEYNLHGIDIDPRAVQIAALALWLRAQKTWKSLGIKAADRLRIARSNIVTAEPMPGEEDMRREFTAGIKPRVLGQLVDVVFEKMKLAGEAGSLLKIEEEIKDAVAEARKQWLDGPNSEQRILFLPSITDRRLKQQELRFDLKGITDERFWEQAENHILDALKDYAERAENGHATRRRLFTEDTAQGFAFIDLFRNRYDVVLMNPPFGDASLPSKPYIEGIYGDTKGDVYKAFVECFHTRLVPAGYLGIISSRTGFFLSQSEDWRTRVVLRLFRPIVLADLGSGVLDAMVEVAAYVLRSLSEAEARDLTLLLVPVLGEVVLDRQGRFSLPKWQAVRDGLKRHQAVTELEHLEAAGFIQRWPGDIIRYTPLWRAVKAVATPPEPVFPLLVSIRALEEREKGSALLNAVAQRTAEKVFICNPGFFNTIPSSPFAYWVSPNVLQLFQKLPPFEDDGRTMKQGLATADDFRFVRMWSEVPAEFAHSTAGVNRTWWVFAKGGAYSPYYSPQRLVVNWTNDGAEIRNFIDPETRKTYSRPQATSFYFRPGLTWSDRTTKQFSARIWPANGVFSVKGSCGFFSGDELLALGLMNSVVFNGLLSFLVGAAASAARSYQVGTLGRVPFPVAGDGALKEQVAALALRGWETKRDVDASDSTSPSFLTSQLICVAGSTLAERTAAWAERVCTSEETVATIQAEIDDLVFLLYGLDAADRAALTSTLVTDFVGDAKAETNEEDEDELASAADASEFVADLLDYGLGLAFGRWDIRYATSEKSIPDLPDPFAPLPVCPPGMLQNEQGLPSRPEDVPATYPLRISWDGILVDEPGFNGAQPHRDDIVRRVREVFDLLWMDKAHEIEQEAREILSVSDLRDYFRKPTGFFKDHLKRYSKSRRKAPVYWPLSTASGSYTLWLYYNRLTDQSIYVAVNKYVEPKITETERGIAHTEDDLKSASGRDATRLTDRLGEARAFLGELRDLREELLGIAALPFKPDLNDGVIINAAPFHKLFRLRPWAKDTEDCWKKLQKGNYDWAHLAYTIWPDRVREVCRKDRSIAIAHGLEDLCEVETQGAKKKGGPGRRKREAAR